MKVLLISPLPPAVGGIARWSEAYLKWSKGNVETVVVNNALLNTAGSRIVRFLSQIKRTVNILRDLSNNLKESDIDIAHVNSSCAKFGILRDYICVKMLCNKNIPVVLQCHCNIEDQLGGGCIARFFFKKTVQHASKILVLNRSSLNFAKENGATDVYVCPNFLAKEKIATNPHKINNELKKAVYIGHLYRDKGVELIIELAKLHPNIEFRLVGPYTKEYDESSVLPNNVVLAGSKDVCGVMKELDEADLFVLLSYSEGFSNAMLEAMARGVPVLASDVGAARDMIGEDGGVIVSAGDTNAASLAVMRLRDADLRTRMSERNRKIVAEYYESETVLGSIMSYYIQIINGSSKND